MLKPDGHTDGITEGRTERRKLYTPRHTSYAEGIIIIKYSLLSTALLGLKYAIYEIISYGSTISSRLFCMNCLPAIITANCIHNSMRQPPEPHCKSETNIIRAYVREFWENKNLKST